MLLALLPLCAAQKQQIAPHPQDAVGVEMVNVLFRYAPSLSVNVVALRGTLIPTAGHQVPSFNDPASFVVGSDAAEFRMSAGQLSGLMNSWILRSPKAQLKDVRITVEGDRLRIRGTMKKGLHVPFNATATVGATADNRIRITLEQVHAATVPVKGLMDALGFTMENLLSQKDLHGLTIDKDSMLIDPQTAFPPPQIRARLSGVRLSAGALVLTFGKGAPKLSLKGAKNFIALRGGRIEYGREQMFDTDLTMIDSTPADPFDFYLRAYWCQMVAGTIKPQPNKALRIYVPDYSKLPRGSCHMQ
jgi:hypothetical protein